jgi:uracil-DNA glycosylase family 4
MIGWMMSSTEQDKRLHYLDSMGIQVWRRRESGRDEQMPVAESGAVKDNPAATAGQDDTGGLDWEALRERVLSCTGCALHKQRTQAVFGVGSHTAQWLIIGEAPGADEDRQGEPFVGRAGKLLNNMLLAIGLQREEVYIANIVKCRPPNNREPAPEEAQSCAPYLARQIALIKPKIIIALGRVAAQNLLRTDSPVGSMRGKRFYYEQSDIPIIVTYHPAYLLRSPQEKRKAWQDLLAAQELFSSL